MYSKFHGTNGQTAARWLRTLKFELETDRTHPYELNNGDWLQLIDGLLEGDAALWADQHPKVKELFSDERTKHATKNDVDTFKALFRERFAPLAENTEEAANIAEFRTLRQRPKEELQDYYRRAEDMLVAAGGADDQRLVNNIIRYYILGLHDLVLCRMMRGTIGSHQFQREYVTLRRAYERSEKDFVELRNRSREVILT